MASSPPLGRGVDSVLEQGAGASSSFFALPQHGVTETLTGSQMVTASEFATAFADAADAAAAAAAAHARARHYEANPSPRVWRRPGGGLQAADALGDAASPGKSERSAGSDHVAGSLMCADGGGLRSTTASSEAAAAAAAAQRGAALSPAAAGRGADAAGGGDWGLVQSATTTAEETSRLLIGGQGAHATP